MASKMEKNKIFFEKSDWIVSEVQKEIDAGIKILDIISNPIVTIFGSHRVSHKNRFYIHAYNTAKRLGTSGHAVLTGGGSGVMEAANKGAKEVGAKSIGFPAILLKDEVPEDAIFTESFSFQFLFARRFILALKSEALVFYPGDFAVLDELFEYLMLMQRGIVDRVPIICVGKSFWSGMYEWLKKEPMTAGYFSKESDLELITIVDSPEEVIEVIQN